MSKRIVKVHKAFIEAFVITGSLTRAAKAAGVDRSQHYRWKKEVPGYLDLFTEAIDHAADSLEDEIMRRAHEGVTEPVYYEGKVVGAKRVYSDGLAMFILRGLRPQKYKQSGTTEVTGKDGAPLSVAIRFVD